MEESIFIGEGLQGIDGDEDEPLFPSKSSPEPVLASTLETKQLRFGDLGLKITAMVSWFGPQNQAGFGLSVLPQNRWREDDVGHASRSSGLRCMEASLTMVSQSGLKTSEGVMAGGVYGTIVEVASRTS
jgi:hypothetical protein